MHAIEVNFIPICTSCGKELVTNGEQTPPDFKPRNPFDRWSWMNSTRQRVFVQACPDCFIHISDIKSA